MDEQAKKSEQEKQQEESKPLGARGVITGVVFGLAFGFLLQKGGVAKYHVLMGGLLLEDFTVFKIMLTAIAVGMVGFFTMYKLGWVKLDVKPTRYAANIIGGLIFGAGFALAGYCPGTSAAAFGQGNLDGLAVMLGLVAGSYLFAEISGLLERTLNRWGDRGKLTFMDLLRAAPRQAPATVLLLLAGLASLASAWI